MREATPGWQFAYIGPGEAVIVDGLDIWNAPRRTLDYSVWLAHPQYPGQLHEFRVYEVIGGDRHRRIALTELSNGCFGIYVPEEQ